MFLRKILISSLCLLALGSFSAVMAQEKAKKSTKKSIGASGNPLPRFASVAHNKANMRTGPSLDYPIKWVYTKKTYPLEIVGEYGPWRKIVERDGTTGWMHTQVLSGKRTAIIKGGTRSLYKDPITSSKVTIIADKGVIGIVQSCTGNWCQLEIDGTKGWAIRSYLYGVYKDEKIK